MKLDDFLDTNFSTSRSHLEPQNRSVSLTLNTVRPVGYVVPTVTAVSNGDHSSSLLLISAAGAMGKSMTSMAIAERLGCPRLDVSKITVGQDSHRGILSRALKLTSFTKYALELDAGENALVIDALDEAPVRSGDRAFYAFMESIAEEARQMTERAHQFIILGRPQTIELFAALCEDMNVDATQLRLDALPLDSALELIKNRVQLEVPDAGAHEHHEKPAHEFWKKSLLNLGATLTGTYPFSEGAWDEVSDFVGYPPVLGALAPTLVRTNYIAASQDLERRQPPVADKAEILSQIIRDLLEREAAKVRDLLGGMFGDRLTDELSRVVYSFEEQISRLLAYLNVGVDPIMPASLPEELRADYESNLEIFVADHPFLNGETVPSPRNIVFSDYLRAVADSGVSYLAITQSRPIASDRLLAIGPFYAYFMYQLHRPENRVPAAIETEDFVQNLLSSWESAAQAADGTSAQYTHSKDLEPLLDLNRSDGRSGRTAEQNDFLQFSIAEPSGILALRTPLSNVSVSTDYDVYIEATAGAITIGPRVQISGQTVESSPIDELIFRGTQGRFGEDEFVAFIVAENLRLPGDFKVVSSPREARAIVVSNDSDQRFAKYRPTFRPIDGLDPRKAVEALLCIRRLLTSFRTTAHDAPAVNTDKLTRHIIGRSSLMRAVADSMKSANLLVIGSTMSTLNRTLLNELEVSYDAYQSQEWEKRLIPVLVHCMNVDYKLVAALRLDA